MCLFYTFLFHCIYFFQAACGPRKSNDNFNRNSKYNGNYRRVAEGQQCDSANVDLFQETMFNSKLTFDNNQPQFIVDPYGVWGGAGPARRRFEQKRTDTDTDTDSVSCFRESPRQSAPVRARGRRRRPCRVTCAVPTTCVVSLDKLMGRVEFVVCV